MGLKDRLRRALADDAPASEAAAPDASPGAHASVLTRLRDFVAAHSDGTLHADDVDVHDHLYDSGAVDSQSAVEMLAFIENEYDVEVSEVDLVGRLSTLDALARHVHEHAAA